MKLIFVIVNNEDARRVIDALNSENFSATKLCSSGGFLKAGNTTILIGTAEKNVERVLAIIKANSKSRTHYVQSPSPDAYQGVSEGIPVEVTVGGATVFITAVERMEKF